MKRREEERGERRREERVGCRKGGEAAGHYLSVAGGATNDGVSAVTVTRHLSIDSRHN